MSEKRKRGGQCLYTEELATEICARLATGQSLREISRCSGMPSASGIIHWLDNEADCPGFAARYARARATWLQVIADEILEISDDSSNDYISRTRSDGSSEQVLDAEHVQRSRLRVDSRKWLLSKLRPGVYGDKLSQEISGPGGAPLKLAITFVAPKPRG